MNGNDNIAKAAINKAKQVAASATGSSNHSHASNNNSSSTTTTTTANSNTSPHSTATNTSNSTVSNGKKRRKQDLKPIIITEQQQQAGNPHRYVHSRNRMCLLGMFTYRRPSLSSTLSIVHCFRFTLTTKTLSLLTYIYNILDPSIISSRQSLTAISPQRAIIRSRSSKINLRWHAFRLSRRLRFLS